MKPKRIAISGASGMVGSALMKEATKRNIEVVKLQRSDYDIEYRSQLAARMEGCDAVINLAGHNIGSRWTKKNMDLIYNSRIETTRAIVNAISSMHQKPRAFFSTSAVGFYPDHGIYTESTTTSGQSFLAKVCVDWETEALRISEEVRCIIGRFGVILSSEDGALSRMKIPFKYYLGGKIGNGNQYVSWIHIDDLISAIFFCLENDNMEGVVNITSPIVTTNKEFMKTLGEVLDKPSFFTTPTFVLKLVLKNGAQILTNGQGAIPEKLTDFGYQFLHPELKAALTNLLSKEP
ncbi:MAG: TIGR01777 family oxidoreductase [Tannerellaceae bacterium]